MFEIKPIFNALLRHKASTLLIVLQIAITLAVLINAASIITQRIAKMDRPSGMVESEIFMLNINAFGEGFNVEQNIRADLEVIRNMPGVKNAIAINQVPISGNSDSYSVANSQENYDNKVNFNSGLFRAGVDFIDTLGLKLIAGRNFREEEIIYTDESSNVSIMLITKSLADKLYPDGDALGKSVYYGGGSAEIIGIIEHMGGGQVHGSSYLDNTILPVVDLDPFIRFMIRTSPEAQAGMMRDIEKTLVDLNPNRVITNIRSVDELRERAYRGDNAMTKILWIVIVLLVTVTALGIVGMASFNVSQRIKQIGTRRALGATHGDIQRYFITENLLLSSLGIAIGVALTIAFNIYLVDFYSLSPLNWIYIPIGIFIMLATGVISVWLPARRAAGISPAVATQTV